MQKLPTILVVDDVPTNIKLLLNLLMAHDFNVLVARTGEMALKIVENKIPHLILLDIMMPGMDGFQTCQHLKMNIKTHHIPVIFMTALASVEDKVKGFRMGGVDYITKPFHREEVLARINTHLTIARLRQELEAKNAELQEKHQLTLELNQQLQYEIQERQKVEIALKQVNGELQRLASIDGLTEVANRRCFENYLQQKWLERAQGAFSLILCDIDHFKLYNDTYGHQEGDECLRQVASTLSQVLRKSTDLVARYGGEEFAVILPNTDLTMGLHIARRIQENLAGKKIVHCCSQTGGYVTLSIGVSSAETATSPEILIKQADDALYQAKEQGRNQICVYQRELSV